MTMLWKQTPKNLPVETELGTVYVNVISGDQVYVSAPSAHARLKFRDKEYHFSCHLELRAGGWQVGRDWTHFEKTKEIRESRTAVYVSKVDSYKINDPVAPTFAKKMLDVVLAAVRDFMKDKQELLRQAAIADVNNDVDRCEAEMEELKQKREAVKQKRYQALEKLPVGDRKRLIAERYGYDDGSRDGKIGRVKQPDSLHAHNEETGQAYLLGYDAGYEATRPLTSDEQAEVDEILKKAGER